MLKCDQNYILHQVFHIFKKTDTRTGKPFHSNIKLEYKSIEHGLV